MKEVKKVVVEVLTFDVDNKRVERTAVAYKFDEQPMSQADKITILGYMFSILTRHEMVRLENLLIRGYANQVRVNVLLPGQIVSSSLLSDDTSTTSSDSPKEISLKGKTNQWQ